MRRCPESLSLLAAHIRLEGGREKAGGARANRGGRSLQSGKQAREGLFPAWQAEPKRRVTERPVQFVTAL